MKKMLFVVLFGFMLAGCAAAQTSNAVQVPDALKLAVSALILAGVTAGLQVVFEWLKLDLRGVGAGIAAAVSGFAIAQLQGFVDVVPVQYDQLVTVVLNVLVVILGGIGYVRILAHRERAAQLFSGGSVWGAPKTK